MVQVQTQGELVSLAANASRSIGRNALVKLASESIARAASLLLTVLAARRLGEDTFGIYNHALAGGLLIAQLGDLGLQATTAREVAIKGRDAAGFVARAFHAKCLVSLAVAAGLGAFAFSRPDGLRATYLCIGFAMLAQTFVEFAAHVFRGEQDLAREARLLAGARVLMAGAGAAVLWCGGGLTWLALAIVVALGCYAAGAVLQLSASGWLMRGHDDSSAQRSWLDVLHPALPLGLATVVSVAYTRLAILLLDHLRGAQAVAQFSAAQRLVEPWQIVPAAVVAAVFPAYASALATDGQRAIQLGWRSTALLTALGGAMALVLWLAAPAIVHVVFTDAFAGSVPVLRILGLSLVPMFANYALTHMLIARGQQRFNLLFVTLMFVLHALLCWRLIPALGPPAAALSVVMAELLLTLCCVSTLMWRSARVDPRPMGGA